MKNEVEDYPEDFDGVFKFTNATDEDFTTLWNNKEYTYPAGKTVPMIIANATLEETQQIRKYFAKRLAEREYFKSKEYNKVKNGTPNPNGGGTLVPSMFNEKVLQPYIDQCLTPLPEGRAKIADRKTPEIETKGTKPLGTGTKENPYPKVDLNSEFKEENEKLLK